jgi:hypothetical protein
MPFIPILFALPDTVTVNISINIFRSSKIMRYNLVTTQHLSRLRAQRTCPFRLGICVENLQLFKILSILSIPTLKYSNHYEKR